MRAHLVHSSSDDLLPKNKSLPLERSPFEHLKTYTHSLHIHTQYTVKIQHIYEVIITKIIRVLCVCV